MRRLVAAALAAVAVVAFAAPATAHVTVQPNEAPTGAFFKFVVRVPNERPDADTTRVQVRFPETVTNVSFQPKEGWRRVVKMVELEEPIEVFGEEVTEAVGSVTWSGGTIAPGEFDEFGFSVRTPDDPAGLEFPAIQTYSNGEVVRWIGPPDADEPAAVVTTVALGLEEGEGELQAFVQLQDQVEGLESQVDDVASSSDQEPAAAEEDDDSSSNVPVMLGSLAVGLIVGGLLMMLFRRKST